MTNEQAARVAAITSASEESKRRIIDSFYIMKNCTDDELLDHCIFVEGLKMGTDSRIKRIESMLDVADSQGQQMLQAMKELQAMVETYKMQNAELLGDVEYWKNKYYRS